VAALLALGGCGGPGRERGAGGESAAAARTAARGGPPPDVMMAPESAARVADPSPAAPPSRGPAPGGAALPAAERARVAGEVVFVSERDGRPAVYAVRAADGRERRVETGPGPAFPGAVSGDGRRLAVVWAADAPGEHVEQIGVLALAASSGAPARRVTPRSARVRSPSWSPDGRWLAFEGDMDGFREVYRVDAAGGAAPRRLTRNREGNFEPAVSPDGRLVAFVSSRDGNNQIYRMRADGTDERRLTAFHRDDWGPVWSPDGGRIAFTSQREGADRVYVMRADGTGQRRLVRAGVDTAASPDLRERSPAWSPDGSRVALARQRRGAAPRVVVVDAASGRAAELPCAAGGCDEPAWSPDGRYLAFTGSPSGATPGAADLYLARADGSGATRLTTSPAADWLPRWAAAR
jgi:Tol biopolymer transport system component